MIGKHRQQFEPWNIEDTIYIYDYRRSKIQMPLNRKN